MSLTRRPDALGRQRIRRFESGQSLVEFALILPIMLVIMLAVLDLSRVYTTMLTIESGAREAADFGTFGSQKWDAAVVAVVPGGTEANMKLRACTAASALPDYIGPDDDCANPSFSYLLSGDRGSTWGPYDTAMACDDPTRSSPCWLKVTLEYDFQLIAPLNLEMLGVTLGIPNTLTFQRSSIFAMTDLSLP